MKILCVHQFASSGLIFEKQLTALTSQLSPTYEYVYINGPVLTPRLKATPDIVKGPFYCWYEGLASDRVKEAHEVIQETIEEDGPFDGVIGYSQGASAVISMLLHHELHHPDIPPPFKFAIFFSPIAVISPDVNFIAKEVEEYSHLYKGGMSEANFEEGAAPEVGQAVALNYDDDDDDDDDDIDYTERSAKAKASKVDGKGRKDKASKPKKVSKHRFMLLSDKNKKALIDELVQLVREMRAHIPPELKNSPAWSKEANLNRPQDFPRFMHPLTLKQRISIPTVFVVGKNDPFLRQSELAVLLVEKKKTKPIYFNGGHTIPVSPPDVRTLVSAVEWAVQKGLQM